MFISDIGFEVPDAFLVGYALDYNEYFRDLSVSLLQSTASDEKYEVNVISNTWAFAIVTCQNVSQVRRVTLFKLNQIWIKN